MLMCARPSLLSHTHTLLPNPTTGKNLKQIVVFPLLKGGGGNDNQEQEQGAEGAADNAGGYTS